jgi:aspartate oxidase
MRNLGIVRNSQSIIRGLKDIIRIERESKGLSAKLNDMILVSKFIISGAYKRKESRGCHLRSDYVSENEKYKFNIDQNLKSLDLEIQKILDTAQTRVDDKNVAL